MCGIFGVVGQEGAARLVKQGLQALEYRGYDSCGVAWLDEKIEVSKALGTVAHLEIPRGQETTAIGHTRWATHGGVTLANAHPHLNEAGDAAVVHNGVLVNHESIRQTLVDGGARIQSQTDSELLVHLWAGSEGTVLERGQALIENLQGTYSLAVLNHANKTVLVAKHRNPMWVARTDGATWFSSDPIALRRHVTEAVPLEDGDIATLTDSDYTIFDVQGESVKREPVCIDHLDAPSSRAGYEHYMLKEIHETPAALNRLLAKHLLAEPPYISLGIDLAAPARSPIVCLGAGTSYHAGLLGVHWLRTIAKVPAQARATPEFKDEPDVPAPGSLLVALSQSGETLDTLQAMHRLRSYPFETLAVTNHPTSTIAREADLSVALNAGHEVSVAATKTFLSQSLGMFLLALDRAGKSSQSSAYVAHASRELIRLPRVIQKVIHSTGNAQTLGRQLALFENLFLLAKGAQLPAAMEGALKLKEIAYQHAEAYPAGELKHGPFALLTAETPVVFLLAPDRNESSVRNSMEEVAARGAPVFVLAIEGAGATPFPTWWLPIIEERLQPLVFSTALHLLSYWVAKARGLPIDRPRNLAKSVTVE